MSPRSLVYVIRKWFLYDLDTELCYSKPALCCLKAYLCKLKIPFMSLWIVVMLSISRIYDIMVLIYVI